MNATSLIAANLTVIGLDPWPTWETVHWGFSAIWQSSSAMMIFTPPLLHTIEIMHWYPVMGAYAFFLFYGFGQDAAVPYYKMFGWLKTVIQHSPFFKRKNLLPSAR
jgi:hypothetical protein